VADGGTINGRFVGGSMTSIGSRARTSSSRAAVSIATRDLLRQQAGRCVRIATVAGVLAVGDHLALEVTDGRRPRSPQLAMSGIRHRHLVDRRGRHAFPRRDVALEVRGLCGLGDRCGRRQLVRACCDAVSAAQRRFLRS
jgi:hypothetical protein